MAAAAQPLAVAAMAQALEAGLALGAIAQCAAQTSTGDHAPDYAIRGVGQTSVRPVPPVRHTSKPTIARLSRLKITAMPKAGA